MTPTEAREAAYDAAYAEHLGGFVLARDYARRLSDYDTACNEIDSRYAEWVAAIEVQTPGRQPGKETNMCKHPSCATVRDAARDGGRAYVDTIGAWLCWGFGCSRPSRARRAAMRAARAGVRPPDDRW